MCLRTSSSLTKTSNIFFQRAFIHSNVNLVLGHKAFCYIISFSTRKIILKSLIYFDQMVVLFDIRYWKCVFNEDRHYNLVL
jgi:hypothetical protein